MRFTGSAEFVASRDDVWAFMIDPTRASPCSPVPIERVADGRYRAVAQLGSGFFGVTVPFNLETTDVVVGERGRIVGTGGISGTTVDGSFSFQLRPGSIDGVTVSDWEIEVNVTGAFAGQATRMLEDKGPDAIRDFISCIHGHIER